MAEATVKMDPMQKVAVTTADGSVFNFTVNAANETEARTKLVAYLREAIAALES